MTEQNSNERRRPSSRAHVSKRRPHVGKSSNPQKQTRRRPMGRPVAIRFCASPTGRWVFRRWFGSAQFGQWIPAGETPVAINNLS